MDARGVPTAACPCCGSTLFRVTVQFSPDTYEIEMYLLDDATCNQCGCFLTAPTPLDNHLEL